MGQKWHEPCLKFFFIIHVPDGKRGLQSATFPPECFTKLMYFHVFLVALDCTESTSVIIR